MPCGNLLRRRICGTFFIQDSSNLWKVFEPSNQYAVSVRARIKPAAELASWGHQRGGDV